MKWALYNLTSTTQSGGVETSVWYLARALMDLGQDVTVLGGQSDRELPQLAQGVKLESFAYRPRDEFPDFGTRFRKLMERLSFARHALPALKGGGFERVVIFKPYDMGPVLWSTRGDKGGGARVGFISGGAEFFPGYTTLARRLDYLAAVSAFHAGQIKQRTGLTAQVNHLGVDGQLFHPAPPDAELAQRFKLRPGEPVLVSAVRLVPLKGLQDAIAALALLPANTKLLVAGEGTFGRKLEQLARELGVEERVGFTGFLNPARLAGFYALGRVALFPSQGEESLGLSAAEALACGLPVVASNLGGLPEVVGADAGLLTPPKEPQALAQAISGLLADQERCQAMARAGQARVAARFSWDACARRLMAGMDDKP